MANRSPARWMAPLALLAALVAVGVIVNATTGGNGASPETATPSGSSQEREGSQATTPETTAGEDEAPSEPRSYRVQPGDTLGAIAEETGVTVEELQELNPSLDPQSLTVGERIRLRR